MNLRVKFTIISGLLFLAISSTIFAAETAVRAYQSFMQQNELARAGDVRTIGPWMTMPYIAHVYHVPESYLYQSLHLPDRRPPGHRTLQTLAVSNHRSVDDLIRTIQLAILSYRKQHPHPPPGQYIRASPAVERSKH